MAHGSKLPRLWDRAIAAILEEPSLRIAAERLHVQERTVLNWLKRPEFKKAFLDARRRVLDATVTRLTKATGLAVEALVRNLDNKKATVQIRAAVAILNHAFRGLEQTDLIERLQEMETLLEGRENENHAGKVGTFGKAGVA